MRTTGLRHAGSNASGGMKTVPVGRGGGTRAVSHVMYINLVEVVEAVSEVIRIMILEVDLVPS